MGITSTTGKRLNELAPEVARLWDELAGRISGFGPALSHGTSSLDLVVARPRTATGSWFVDVAYGADPLVTVEWRPGGKFEVATVDEDAFGGAHDTAGTPAEAAGLVMQHLRALDLFSRRAAAN